MDNNKKRKIVIYDIETLRSCFTYSAINVSDDTIYQFVLHKDKFEISDFVNHLLECNGQIGFNNLNFDYPVIHYILKNYKSWVGASTSEQIIDYIYKEAQRIIEVQNQENFNQIVAIPTKNVLIPQLDLFKIWHFNNKARRRIAA